jgi:PmbA protein
VKPRRTVLIDKGVLNAYLLNSYYARVLDRETTGNAVISDDARFDITPSNSFIEAGQSEPKAIIADVSSGLYVTRYLSFGVPAADYFTQAVQGFWIEDGKLSYPVRSATVSSRLKEMLMNIEGVGNDLNTRFRFASPTLLISKMEISSGYSQSE